MEILNKLVEEDKDFAEAKFKAKVDNMFIQLYTAVMKQDLTRVKHFLSNEVYDKYNNKIQQLQSKNYLQLYFQSTNTADLEKKNYNAKTYKYGYVINMPYENNVNNTFFITTSIIY